MILREMCHRSSKFTSQELFLLSVARLQCARKNTDSRQGHHGYRGFPRFKRPAPARQSRLCSLLQQEIRLGLEELHRRSQLRRKGRKNARLDKTLFHICSTDNRYNRLYYVSRRLIKNHGSVREFPRAEPFFILFGEKAFFSWISPTYLLSLPCKKYVLRTVLPWNFQ